MNGLQLRVLDRLGDHAAAWDALVDASPLPSPFLRSWWLDHVAEGEPVVLLAFDGEELIGGLALQRSHRTGVEWLEFLGDGPLQPDHLDLVAVPGRVAEVVDVVRSWVTRPGDRVVDLRGARAAAWVLDAVPGRGGVSHLEVAPYVALPTTAEAYLASRGGRTRSTITRTAKRLEKAGVTFRVVGADERDPIAAGAALDALAELHDGRWGDRSGFLAGWERFRAAALAGIAAGEFHLHELVDADGAVIAVEADFVVAGRMSFYQAGRLTDHEWRGSGSALRFRVVGEAITAGCSEFDLLRGGEEYKAEWADARRGLLRIRRGFGPRGRALAFGAQANVWFQAARAARHHVHDEHCGHEAAAAPSGAPRTRIAFYTDATQIGGAETVAKTLLGGLSDRFDVMVVGVDQDVVSAIASVRPSTPTLVVPAIADKRDVAAMAAHRSAIAALDADVFHANLSEGSSCQYALLAALSVRGLPVVVTENSPMGVRTELSRRIKSWSAPKFDAHIGVGVEAARLVEQDVGLAPGSVEVIPNAVPRHERPIPDPDRVGRSVVCVSRFDKVKGLDVAVEAMARLVAADADGGLADVTMTIYGDGPERPKLEAMIAELGVSDRVRLAGWVDDVRSRLVDHDVFLLPSRLEGMPMSLLEAMHAGIASVATDVGSVREVLDDGVTGTVVPAGDPSAIAGALADLLADPAKRAAMGAAARQVALERFSAEVNVAAYEAVYDRVTAGPPKRSRRR